MAPEFDLMAFSGGDFKRVKLSDYKGKWVVLAFYPADFTFICPTELARFADYYGDFQNLGAEVLSVSTDTEQVHKAWWDASDSIKKIKFPMLSDTTGSLCRDYGTYIYQGDDAGRSLRATIIIDPDGIVKAIDMHDNSIGRSVKEVLRKLKAAIYVSAHSGEVCPVEWEEGQSTLKPGVDLVGKI
ncbi:MAG: redoxin domain-containing protein [Candidatus Pacearchaeota archaeon]|nr:redoxin domain-containing protein [Candidatus Pacearchaeota archaeon]